MRFFVSIVLLMLSLSVLAQSPSSGSGLTMPASKLFAIGQGDSCKTTLLESEFDPNRNTLVLTKREDCYPSISISYAVFCTPMPCDFSTHRVFKEVYGVKDNRLVIIETIEGKIEPAKSETFVWPSK